MDHTVEILHTGVLTHDVKQFVTTRPDGLDYEPGQGVELALDRDGWREEGRPFTPTGDPEGPALEFVIKEYPEHDGVTRRLHELRPGDRLLLSGAFGTITDRGPGTFIAGGAGVTPFLALLRRMGRDGRIGDASLVFSNRTPADVICEKELRHLLGDRLHLTCTRESGAGYDDRRIDRPFLEETLDDVDQPFYVCGPPAFTEDVREALDDLGASSDGVVFEE